MRSLLRSRPADIDVRFDVPEDAGSGDADISSPTLRKCPRLLWRKALASDAMFELSESTPGVYLHHRSELGEFFVTGDTVSTGFRKRLERSGLVDDLPPGL